MSRKPTRNELGPLTKRNMAEIKGMLFQARSVGQEVKAELAVKNARKLQEKIQKAFNADEKWAIELIGEICAIIDPKPLITLNFFQMLGVAGEEEAKRLIEIGRQAEDTTQEQRIAAMEQALLQYYRKNPAIAEKSVLARHFNDSLAEVLDHDDEGNGAGYADAEVSEPQNGPRGEDRGD